MKTETLLTPYDEIPDWLQRWVNYEGSITEKLRQQAGNAQMEILCHQWCQPDWWDKHVLNVNTEKVIHREIVMSAWEVPCWYARTIISDSCYEANRSLFDQLQHKLLGELIHNNGDIKRLNRIIYPIDPQTIEYHWVNNKKVQCDATLRWIRISTFSLSDHLFYLAETFFPALMRYSN